jgi:hypothetical protein
VKRAGTKKVAKLIPGYTFIHMAPTTDQMRKLVQELAVSFSVIMYLLEQKHSI